MATLPLDTKFHQQLFRVTEKLQRLRTNRSAITIKDYKEILQEVCSSMKISLENGLEDIIRHAADLISDPATAAKARAVVEDIRTFTEFIEFQNRALTGCGLSADAAAAINEKVASLREELMNLSYNAEEVHRHIVECCGSACAGAGQAEEFVADRLKRFELTKETLLVEGSVLLISSAAVTAITGALAAPFAAISAAAGAIFIRLSSVVENPVEKPPK